MLWRVISVSTLMLVVGTWGGWMSVQADKIEQDVKYVISLVNDRGNPVGHDNDWVVCGCAVYDDTKPLQLTNVGIVEMNRRTGKVRFINGEDVSARRVCWVNDALRFERDFLTD